MSDKFRPTLDSNLVEGLLAECISQIKMSRDCCNEWQKSNMTLAQNVSATKTITRDEVWNVLDVTQYHTSKTLRPKHWMFIDKLLKRLRRVVMIILSCWLLAALARCIWTVVNWMPLKIISADRWILQKSRTEEEESSLQE